MSRQVPVLIQINVVRRLMSIARLSDLERSNMRSGVVNFLQCSRIRSICVGFSFTLSLAGAGVLLSGNPAGAVVYCQYVDYPPSCVARAGVVLRPRPVARAVVRPGTPMNRGGPVDRVGRR